MTAFVVRYNLTDSLGSHAFVRGYNFNRASQVSSHHIPFFIPSTIIAKPKLSYPPNEASAKITQTMSSPLSFLDLPAETRLLVYDYVWSESSSIVNQPLPAAAAMLRTCKTVHDELLVSLFSSDKVVLDTHRDEYMLMHAIPSYDRGKQLARLNPLARESLAHVSHNVHLQHGLCYCGSVFKLQQNQLSGAFDQCANLRTVRLDFDYDYEEEWLPMLFGFAVWISENLNTNATQIRLNLLNLNIGSDDSPKSHSLPAERVASLRSRVRYSTELHGMHMLKLPPLLHTVDIVSSPRRGPGKQLLCRDDLYIPHDLLLSLPLPPRYSLVKISGAPEDERWVYELNHDRSKNNVIEEDVGC